jgi:hypothetical protein
MTVEGYYHTRNKKKYMIRLYIAQLIMSIGNDLLDKFFPRPDNVIIMSSMFKTLFLIVVYLSIVDFLRGAFKDKNISRVLLGIGFLAIPILLGFVITISISNLPFLFIRLFMLLIPIPLLVEGGIVFIAIGIVLYLFRDNKTKQVISFIIMCIVIMLLSGNLSIQSLLYTNFQWMMIFAAPLMYLYNGEKGRGMKYLFYIFYPAHIYLFHMISYYMLTR